MDEVVSEYYVRFQVADQPGVLAAIAGSLAEQSISIASVIQRGRSNGDASVPLVIRTHAAGERNLKAALRQVNQLPVVEGQAVCVRIEEISASSLGEKEGRLMADGAFAEPLAVSTPPPFRAWFGCASGCSGQWPLNQIMYYCPKCGSLLDVQHDLDALRTRPAETGSGCLMTATDGPPIPTAAGVGQEGNGVPGGGQRQCRVHL